MVGTLVALNKRWNMKAAFYFILCIILFVADFLKSGNVPQKGHA